MNISVKDKAEQDFVADVADLLEKGLRSLVN